MKEFFRNLYILTTGAMALIAFGLAIYFRYQNSNSNGLASLMALKHFSQFILFGTISVTLILFNQDIYLILILACLPYIWAQYKFIQYIKKL